MKKIVLTAIALIACMAIFSCASSGGGVTYGEPGIVLDSPILFENGVWNSQLGRVTATLKDGTTGSFANGKYTASAGTAWAFQFENSVDARGYTRLIVEIEENDAQIGWWAGGQILCYYAPGLHDPDTGTDSNISLNGFWNDIKASRKFVFYFNGRTKQDQDRNDILLDPSNIIGFTSKVSDSGRFTIVKAYFE